MALLAALLVLLVGAATAEARTVVEKDARDGTRAELAYDRGGDRFNPSYRDFALSVYDDGELVLEGELATCGGCDRYSPAGFGRTRSIRVRDLDGGRPEVLVDFYTGGAYCCWLTLVYRPRGDGYARTAKNWGPKRPRLVNLGGGNARVSVPRRQVPRAVRVQRVLALPPARLAL